ncbi:MAG TPA: DUF503 domain-containing protein [Kofleriaceae bacterium]|jgi:hypothetical protein|nr:DUF503 domain-containing protein [Kofleriaceae bacterium]
MAKISLMLAEAHSLKEKRMVLRRIKDRVRERLGVFVSEVGSPESKDSWQRSELGVAVASGDRQKAISLIDDVIRVALAAGGAAITAVARDAVTFDAEASPISPALTDDRTGAGDKAVAGDDWIPDAWREEPV